ncbi:DNA excision repair protein ERCC-8 [Aplysia californica]|uniref:DNA excision repair protein ERCC-8 n=1 Tax=Aplysia californica TaxID=6500 RepID=A0ABM0JMF2_APLCA|nr:DNA excision repair protein ERCC-8 [Aplysia californica]
MISLPKYLAGQSAGLVSPLLFQHKIFSYYTERVELSRLKDVQPVHSSAVNDLDIDVTEHRYLLSGSADGSIAIHDLEKVTDEPHVNGVLDAKTYKLVCSVSSGNRSAHRASIETVQWFPLDTGIFTSSGTDRTLKVWDANRLKPAEEYSFNGVVHCHQMSQIASKHNLVAVGTDSSVVKLVDPRAGSATHSLRGHKEGAVRAVCWSNRDEFQLATGGIDNFAILWDVRTAKGFLMKLQNHGKKRSGYSRDTTHDGSVNGLHYIANGHTLATVGTDQKLFVWDTYTGKKLPARYPPISHIKKRSVKFCVTSAGSENFAFVPTGSSITTFNIDTVGKARHLYGHYNSVNCCVYHEQGCQLLSGGNDHKILAWTIRGDRDYGEHVSEQRHLVQKSLRTSHSVNEEVQETPVSEAVLQTLDTWSDDEEEEEEEGNNSSGR